MKARFCAAVLGLTVACGEARPAAPEDAIRIGALLPFTGREAAIGRNLEEAMLLAVADVNRAGGVLGRPLELVARDSNSGSARGLDELLNLLYNENVKYLIGPEEQELAKAIVPDIKGLNILNILPGYAAPPIQHVSHRGAWLRLAPTPGTLGCAIATDAVRSGVESANALVTLDDFHGNLATDFSGQFSRLGGTFMPSISVNAGAATYQRKIQQVLGFGAERTLLLAYPATASTITTEWTVTGRGGSWYLSPMLHADVFLQNVPFGALDGMRGLSPSLSLEGECHYGDSATELTCKRDNAQAFTQHFSEYWSGAQPFPAAHFYYDAVILLALGLVRAAAEGNTDPGAQELHTLITEFGTKTSQHTENMHNGYGEMNAAFAKIIEHQTLQYIGAAAEYEFDVYGAAQHTVFDTWTIENGTFVETGSLKARCPRTF